MVGLDFYIPSTLEDEVEKLGYILERDERAKNFIDWRQEKENAVRSAVAGLERPKVRAMSLELEKMDAYVEARSYEREAKEKEKRGEYGAAIELWKRYAEVKERKGSYFFGYLWIFQRCTNLRQVRVMGGSGRIFCGGIEACRENRRVFSLGAHDESGMSDV